jgi:copper chaperone CopZ
MFHDPTMTEKSFAIEGMNCASCAAHVEKAALRSKVEGITFASVNLATERLTISYDERKASVSQRHRCRQQGRLQSHR